MDIYRFFEERRRMLDRGQLGYDRLAAAYYNFNQPNQRMLAMANASAQGRAELSDPFVRDRVLSRIASGAAMPSDYEVDWAPETKSNQMGKQIEVLSPRNRKVV